MANLAPATLEALLEAIHSLYEGNTTYAEENDDDWLLRRDLINSWISRWENADGTMWNELWADNTARTFLHGSHTYAGPADMRTLGGFIKLDLDGQTMHIPVIRPDQVQLQNSTDLYAYQTGRIGAYQIHIYGISDDRWDGATIHIPHYKQATKLEVPTDICEVPDPYFIIHGVVADLHSMNRNNSGYQLRLAQAEERLGQMQMRNEMTGPYQSGGIEDVQYELYGSGFGY